MQETDIEARHAAYMLSAAYAYIEAAAHAGIPHLSTSLPDLSTSVPHLVRRYT